MNVRAILFAFSLLLASPLALTSATAQANKPARPAPKAPTDSVASPAQLPVARVSLYKNGVGFFEHAGHVTGDQAVTIDFTTAQLNDVLQSLTAIDLNGGRISGAGYNSTTPFEQQLKSLPLALGEDANAADFYNAIRGARVSVTGSGAAITGRLLNIEVTEVPATNNQPATQKRLLTVIGDDASVRTVDLTSATSVRLLDSQLHSDVSRYLELLASTRNDGLRHLTLQDNGAGSRELHVSYLSEVPIWKSTYRILFTEPDAKSAAPSATAQPSEIQSTTLQGWSVVDNTTGADWINVHLSLIAGAPQSFIQPLSVPYYSRRPEIGLPQEAQLSPQTHESGDPDELQSKLQQLAGPSGAPQGGQISIDGFAGGVNGRNTTELLKMAPSANASATVLQGDALNSLSVDTINGRVYSQLAQASIVPNSTTAAFDDYFAYNLTDPITIRKNESALVPILQTKINAERVTLWSQQQPTPLRALWVTNTSNLTLDRGSFTIVENGDFGGEGLLDPIHPGEKRLLSYAVDQAVRVSTESNLNSQHVTSITAAKGVLVLQSTDIDEITYLVHNAAADPRTVVVEHPVRAGFTLDSDPKPEETTPSVYRFRVATQAGETVRLHVGERHDGNAVYQLTSFDDSTLTYVLSQVGSHADAIRQALQPILDARAKVAAAQIAVNQINTRLASLRSDEDRQRANVTALASADKTSRDRFVHDLNATEDQIAVAQRDLTAAQANLQSAKDDLANKIQSIQLDQQL